MIVNRPRSVGGAQDLTTASLPGPGGAAGPVAVKHSVVRFVCASGENGDAALGLNSARKQ
jgi:hypothetical protein